MDQHPFQICENESALKTLALLRGSGRFPHAILFEGEKGIGKRALALYTAALLLCESKGDAPCGHCLSCRKALAGSHPDIERIAGEREGAGGFHIREIREMRSDVYVGANESNYKIYILEEVQDMTVQAQNALLKVLEEPPAGVVFLLCARSGEELLPTILSRTVRIRLAPVSAESVYSILKNQFPDAQEDRLRRAASLSEGIAGKGIELMQDEKISLAYDTADKFCRALLSRRRFDVMAALSPAAKDKALFTLFLSAFETDLRGAVLIRTGAKGGEIYPKESTPACLAAAAPLSHLVKWQEVALEAADRYSRSANYELLLTWISDAVLSVSEG